MTYKEMTTGCYGFKTYEEYRSHMKVISDEERIEFHKEWDRKRDVYIENVKSYIASKSKLEMDTVKAAFRFIENKIDSLGLSEVKNSEDLRDLYEKVALLDKFNREPINSDATDYITTMGKVAEK